ncbi:hypothetical protein B296_00040403 [Ensete ventricosum]|uniref:Uncharacterized protein n=1 Tax=Ensete ventricosum TaxID=4639 RepID=A0A426YXW6_ENSVE|nr:hypothetical protein B296_00040403 [Ensete ventricosum]
MPADRWRRRAARLRAVLRHRPRRQWRAGLLIERGTAGPRSREPMVQLQGAREHSMGLPRYVARLKVLPLRDDGRGEGGCELRWPFHSDPLQAWTKDGFVAYLQTGLEGMAEPVRTNEKNLKQ